MARWSEVRAALEELLALPEESRSARLEALARRDAELGREVASLLEHDAAAAREGDRLARDSALAFAGPEEPGAREKRRVGPYELLRELGRGGMGVVHLARRADGAFERRVAVKLIQSGVSDERLLQRFRRERQVLANLEHPGIARLIEGGATADGTPYLVMEYVEGVPIDRYCDLERLPLRARIELFLQVCDAVQHAHEHLVVHRDLKPGNVVVTTSGEPKLLDFGIAKVLDPEKTSASPEVTVGPGRFLTPAYASPEQVSGRPVTTASDVYSLGVLLYRLLTGEQPYSLETTSAAEIERIVCEAEPPRASSVLATCAAEERERRARARLASPRSVQKALAGDLDRVLAKALRKEPRLRYASVERFADDLRRHHMGLPVAARGDTLSYRASKFVRRNRAAVGAGVAVLVALVGALVFSRYQFRVVEAARASEAEQRELAEQRFEDVRGFATNLIYRLHGMLMPIEGTTKAQEFIAQTGVDLLDRLAADAEGDFLLQRQLVQAYVRVAAIQGTSQMTNLGHQDEALASIEKAADIARSLIEVDEPDINDLLAFGTVLCTRGMIQWTLGREGLAREDFHAADEACGALAEHPGARYGHVYLAYISRQRVVEIERLRVDVALTLARMRECVPLMERVVEIHGPAPIRAELELARGALGELVFDTGSHAEGIAMQRACVAALGEIRAESEDQNTARALRVARRYLAQMLVRTGGFEEARALLAQNRGEHDAGFDRDDVQVLQDRVDDHMIELDLCLAAGDTAAGLRLGERELAQARTSVERAPESAFAAVGLGNFLVRLATCQREEGQLLAAVQHLTEAREIFARLVDQDEEFLAARIGAATAFLELGRAHRAAGTGDAYENAVVWLERGVDTLERLPEPARFYARLDLEAARDELDACRGQLEGAVHPADR